MASSTKSFDAAVVGAGIVGAACAYALSKEGLSVALIDAGHAACGTTAAGMGHIVVMDDSDAQFSLTNYSQDLWRELAPDLPSQCEYEHCGTIWVAADEDELSEAKKKKLFYAERGIETELLDRSQLRAAEPNLREGLAGGLLVPSDDVVYQLGATRYLVDAATSRKTVLFTKTMVSSISKESVQFADGQKLAAGVVVNAAGPSASQLSPSLAIKKRKGHLVITERYPQFVRHQLVELEYLRSAHGTEGESVAFNVQPRSTGQILLGSSRQFDKETAEVDQRLVRRMTERAFDYMPRLHSINAIRIWTGFRPATPDNLPYIGKMSDGVYAAAGHEGLGITTSLATGALIADAVIGRPSPIDPTPYLPTRVAEH